MGPKPSQLIIFLHGGPGTGKSFLEKCIDELALEYKFTIGCMAPTGIAASNLPEGRTIHNFCGIPVSNSNDSCLEKPTVTTLNNLRDRTQVSTIGLVLIDEISNVGPRLFGHINTRLQHIMENDEFFGGLAVVTMGDLLQLPPVRPAETLYSGILSLLEKRVSLNTENTAKVPRYIGIRLFKTFKKIELTEQMRAADDVKMQNC
jgi:hypothetical protein